MINLSRVKIEKSRIIGFNIKANYTIKEEVWSVPGTTIPTKKHILAYTHDGKLIGPNKGVKKMAKRFKLSHFELENPNRNMCTIAFSEKEQRWYGISRELIGWYGIGSTVVKADPAYKPKDKTEFIADIINHYTVPGVENLKVEEQDGNLIVSYEMNLFNGTVIPRTFPISLDVPYGKGEWTAQTLDDAKEMAITLSENLN